MDESTSRIYHQYRNTAQAQPPPRPSTVADSTDDSDNDDSKFNTFSYCIYFFLLLFINYSFIFIVPSVPISQFLATINDSSLNAKEFIQLVLSGENPDGLVHSVHAGLQAPSSYEVKCDVDSLTAISSTAIPLSSTISMSFTFDLQNRIRNRQQVGYLVNDVYYDLGCIPNMHLGYGGEASQFSVSILYLFFLLLNYIYIYFTNLFYDYNHI